MESEMNKSKSSSNDAKNVYVMTVGTGTAGKYSNLAQGLVNAVALRIEAIKQVYLVPSHDENSHSIAELVMEELMTKGIKAQIVASFSNPDGLLVCRREFREILSKLKKKQIIVNPTSGTKQMTAGATLATLDMGLGLIEFIGGERVDGIVKTGTEKIETVDAARLSAEQSARNILVLLKNGDFSAVALLAEMVESSFPLTASICRMLSAWNRLNYSEASRSAPAGDEFAAIRNWLDNIRASVEYSLERIADLLALAERELKYSRVEEALSAIYRSVELMARFHLKELGCPPEMCFADHICKMIDVSGKTRKKLYKDQENHQDRTLRLGLSDTLDILERSKFELCKLRNESRLWHTLQDRNETRFGHGDKCIRKEKVQKLYDAVCKLALNEWNELGAMIEKSTFPDFEENIQKEINNESK